MPIENRINVIHIAVSLKQLTYQGVGRMCTELSLTQESHRLPPSAPEEVQKIH